jgi:hypothetical protein
VDRMRSGEREILRELAHAYVEAASDPRNEENIREWTRSNGLRPGRVMVSIAQIPWHELDMDGSLSLQTDDPFCRGLEQGLRRMLFQWKHFPADLVLLPWIQVQKKFTCQGIGVSILEETIQVDDRNPVQAHHYHDRLATQEDLETLHNDTVVFDRQATELNLEKVSGIFGDILPARATGVVPSFKPWDELAMLRGVEPILYDMADRPEFLHDLMERMTTIAIDRLGQFEREGLLDCMAPIVHCSGAFTDELPRPDHDGTLTRSQDSWAYGMAQLFATCSPEQHDEFEFSYASRFYRHCGLVYYGCCEPLHDRIDRIRRLPGVRKISISPWADSYAAAAAIGRDFVMSCKPNPALLAMGNFDEEAVRIEIAATLQACRSNGTPCELILKDISTVRYDPGRLTRWNEIVRECVERG